MINIIENTLLIAFEKLGLKNKFCKVNLSNRPELCDYQINSVFNIAKEQKKNPIEIGEELVKEINNIEDFSSYFESVEFVKPGFINIKVSDKLINNTLNKINEDKNIGIEKVDNKITCVLDYGGPNIAKPLHVGHLRTALIGQSMYKILKAKGYNALGDVHLGDYGLQIGQVIYGLKNENIKTEDITIKVLDYIYPKYSKLCKENKDIYKECEKLRNKLQQGDKECNDYFKVIFDISIKDIKRMYKFLNVEFDYWYGEKDAFPYMKDVLKYFNDKNLIEEDDGALIVRIAKDDDKKKMPPLLLQGSDGAYLYATSDIATIYQRMKDFNPDYILYFVDGRQSLHFEQVFRACALSGLSGNAKLEHDFNGTVNDAEGKPFKTRSGDTVKLDSLINDIKECFINSKESNKDLKQEDIDIIVNAIIKFAELQNNRERDYNFDISKFASVNGKTGPYILYTSLRIKKLINDNIIDNDILSDKIYNKQDKELRMKLLEINDVVTKSADTRMPHFIADYLYDLCVLTNAFYQNNNINTLTDESNKNDWINLLKLTYKVIEKLLSLLVIKIPSEM